MAYEYEEAVAKSLCFACRKEECFKPDTERKQNYAFKPIVMCSGFERR